MVKIEYLCGYGNKHCKYSNNEDISEIIKNIEDNCPAWQILTYEKITTGPYQ